jgi:membrane fusion protein (multidrug efflux system)
MADTTTLNDNVIREISDMKTAVPAKAVWWKSEVTKKVVTISLGVAALLVLVWFFFFRPYLKTDDARVAMTLVKVAPSGVSGRIEKVNVEEGTVVKKGDVLVELDHRINQAQVDRAQSKVDLARKELYRLESLVRQNSAPQRDLDNARANFTLAQAELTLAQVALENTYLRAPFDGIIVQKIAEVGNILESGQTAVAVADREHAWISANIEETEVADVKVGQPVTIYIDEGGKLTGKVSEVRAATAGQFALIPSDNASGNFVKVVQRIPIKIALDNGSETLKSGQSVEIKIKVK